MSAAEGPLGPGLRRCDEEEKSRRHFQSSNALWSLDGSAWSKLLDTEFVLDRAARSPTASTVHLVCGNSQIRNSVSSVLLGMAYS